LAVQAKCRIARLRFHTPYTVVGVDPGLQATGVALLEGGFAKLWTLRSGYVKTVGLGQRVLEMAAKLPPLEGVDSLVIEHMKVYIQRKQEGDPNDLVNLAVVEGVMLATISAKSYYLPTPAEWNRGVIKRVRHQRLRSNVIEEPDGRVSEHAMDALGLAVYGLERVKWLHQQKTHGP